MSEYTLVMAAWLFGLFFGFMVTTDNCIISGVVILLITALLLAAIWYDYSDKGGY